MEQYAHLLISADPNFVPDVEQIVTFFNHLHTNNAFRFVYRPPFEPGIVVLLPSDKPRILKNSWTGEEITIPGTDRRQLEKLDEIPAILAGMAHYTISVSGEWSEKDVPIKLFTTDEAPFKGDPICSAQCGLRPHPVCTSDFGGELDSNEARLLFDRPESPIQSLGVFTNPWNAEPIKVPGAGSARFWIAFEFGKWLFPRLDDGFNLLKPDLVVDAESCFGIRFLQAGHGI